MSMAKVSEYLLEVLAEQVPEYLAGLSGERLPNSEEMTPVRWEDGLAGKELIRVLAAVGAPCSGE